MSGSITQDPKTGQYSLTKDGKKLAKLLLKMKVEEDKETGIELYHHGFTVGYEKGQKDTLDELMMKGYVTRDE